MAYQNNNSNSEDVERIAFVKILNKKSSVIFEYSFSDSKEFFSGKKLGRYQPTTCFSEKLNCFENWTIKQIQHIIL